MAKIDMMDAFSLLGLEIPEDMVPVEPKKEEKKETKVNKPALKEKKKRLDSVELPVKIITGYGKAFTLSDTAFDKKPEDVVMADVKKVVAAMMPGLSENIATSIRKDERTVYVTVNQAFVQAKGTVKLNKETKCYLFDKELPLVDVMTEDECEVDVEVITNHFAEQYPGYIFSVVYSAVGNIIALIPGKEEETTFHLPVTLKVFGKEDIVLTAADFAAKKATTEADADSEEETEEGEEEDETEDEEPKAEVKKDTKKPIVNIVTAKQVSDKLVEKYPDFKDATRLMKGVKDEKAAGTNILVRFVQYNPNKSYAPAPKKEETYPTNATVSFVLHRFQLKPEDFGGKKEVNKKELCAFLRKTYPEYEESRTWFAYDKDKNLIMPQIKGSGKGADVYPSYDEAVAAAQGKDYFLCNFPQGGNNYRLEKTMVSMTVATDSGDSGSFEWYLPKVDRAIYEKTDKLFRRVSEEFNTEALVHLYYLPETKEYEIEIPPQVVSYAAVHETNFPFETPERFRVMDIHSHGTINAFFSSTDNRDEKGNRLFGVFGGYKHSEPEKPSEFVFRAGTGGKYFYLPRYEVFGKYCSSYTEDEVEELYNEWLEKAQIPEVRRHVG